MKHLIPMALTLGPLFVACAAQPVTAQLGPGPAASPTHPGAPGAAPGLGVEPTAPPAEGDGQGTSSHDSRPVVQRTDGPSMTPSVTQSDAGPDVQSAVRAEQKPTRPRLAPVACDTQRERGQLALSPEEYDLRTGKDARALADLRTSRERPVEVCGVHDQHALLMSLTCADGSRPLTTTTDARRARLGSVGTGGRCGKIIDLYRVTCPDRRHDIYMDAYYCRNDQSLDRLNTPPAPSTDPDDAAPADADTQPANGD